MKRALVTILIPVVVACGGTDSNGPSGVPATGGKPGQAASVGGGASLGGATTGGTKGASGGANASLGGAAVGAGGNTATGSDNSGGTSSGGVANSMGGSTASNGGSDGSLPSCDPSKIRCRIAAPLCAQGEVPSVVGTCYGPCVKIDQCSCTTAEQCPDPNQFTCLIGPQHCSYFLR